MSTDELQRELHRIADGAPVADVPRDTWQQARRSVVRDRVVTVAAAAVAVGIVAVGTTWLPHQIKPPVAKTDAGAIPSRIFSLPEDEHLPVETDLALGPVSAAYVVTAYDLTVDRIVVVTAMDGKYHVVELPDARTDADDIARSGNLALSPDGRQLAYAYTSGDASQPATGVGFVDLESGTVRKVRLSSVWVRNMYWSPGGTQLLWWGQKMGTGPTTAGLIGPDGSTASIPTSKWSSWAAGDDGTVAIMDLRQLRIWRDGEIVSTTAADSTRQPWTGQLADGVLSQVRTPYPADPGESADTSVFARGDSSAEVPDRIMSAPRVSELGWTPDGALLILRDNPGEKTVDQNVYELRLDDDKVTARKVISLVPGQSPEQLTVATALPIEELATPRWAQHRAPLYVGLGIAGGLVLLCAGWLLRRRYRVAR
jgi:hypothetical protein